MTKGGGFILPSDTLTDLDSIFTVYNFTDEQKMFRDSLKEFMAREVLSQTDKIESKDWDLTRKVLLQLGELGALGVEVSEQYGGQGLEKTTAAIFAEEMGWQGSFACTALAATGIGLLPILFFGTEEQKRRFVPSVVTGRLIGAYSLTEASSGSDAKSLKSKAVLRNDGRAYVLSGQKIFVTNGSLADYYVVFAKVGEGTDITAFIVERGFLGVEIGPEEHKMGILGSSTTSLNLNNVTVPIENIVGEVGKGFNIALNILNLGRFKLGAACLGGAKQCFEESLKYSRERKQFGLSIGNFGAIRQKLCRMAALIYGMEAIIYRTAGLMDATINNVDKNDPKALMSAIREYASECSLVKIFCSEASHEITVENIQIHGGNGFMKDYPAERHLRDSVINMIFEGTNSINRLVAVNEALQRMAPSLMQEGKKIQAELLSSTSPVLSDSSSDIIQVLRMQINGAKKALVASGGSIFQKLGQKLADPDNQEVVILMAECLVYIYVLDSALAVLVKHSREKDEYLTRLLFHLFLPEIEKRTRTLIAMGSEGDEQRTLFAVVRKIFKYSPENLLYLDRKIAEHFN